MITPAEENYLKAVFKLSEKDKAVSTNDLAHLLGTTPASVSDMVKKLSEKKLLAHQPYKGVRLTPTGRKSALDIVRKHRLWEVFLTEKLQISWDSVHEIAEQLEHIQSPDLIRKLDAFLGYPRFDPHGDPIPDEHGKLEERRTVLLKDAKKGTSLSLAGVLTDNASFLQYLDKQQIKIGTKLTVVDILPYDKSITLVAGKRQLTLSALVCEQLLMTEES
jgi:DtxR family Mn-dependent transcriptional regulator